MVVGKGEERWQECEVEIMRLEDPGAGIDSLQRRSVLSDHRGHTVAPDVSTRAEMRKHIVRRPTIVVGSGTRLRRRQAGGKSRDASRRFVKQGEHLLNRECLVGHNVILAEIETRSIGTEHDLACVTRYEDGGNGGLSRPHNDREVMLAEPVAKPIGVGVKNALLDSGLAGPVADRGLAWVKGLGRPFDEERT